MANIAAGRYTYRELFNDVGFNFEDSAAADYNDGAPDFRRVKVGGVGFDSLDDVVVVPYTADTLDISVDGKAAQTLNITLSPEDERLRKLSFESAADATDPNA